VNSTVDHSELFTTRPILGVNVAVSSYDDTIQRSLDWARKQQSRALFFATVHMIMEAYDDPVFLRVLNRADLVDADGMPLAWALRSLGEKKAMRVCGPDAMPAMLAAAAEARVSVGFYGGSQTALDSLIEAVRLHYPDLDIAFAESPPFRKLSSEEDAATVDHIAASGARLLFVGLGCPKQENWIMEHLGRVPAVMLGVGAAFDFVAGSQRRAPRWMMRSGLEWLFRLASEPRRLAKRYIKHNPRFVFLFLRQLLTETV
jgi:N-acetylglucosaminyldiphosphoundecaprenol N-acetyl-beta-D-mannosaminyltransferase